MKTIFQALHFGFSPALFHRLKIEQLCLQVESRLRWARVLNKLPKLVISWLLLLFCMVISRRFFGVTWVYVCTFIGLFFLIYAFYIFFLFKKKLPPQAGSRALDKFYKLDGQISAAHEFIQSGHFKKNIWAHLTVSHSEQICDSLIARHAVPLRVPSWRTFLPSLFLGFLLCIAFVYKPKSPAVFEAQVTTLNPLDLNEDDLNMFKTSLNQALEKEENEEIKKVIKEMNSLLSDVAEKRLSYADALKHIKRLEEEFLKGEPGDPKRFDALKKAGEKLQMSDLTRHAGKSLASHDLDEAQKEFKVLAKTLRKLNPKLNKEQLERMKQAIKTATENLKKTREALLQKREEIKEQLLKQKEQKLKSSENEPSLLQKKERELERLERDEKESDETSRRLERLERELNEAAEHLMKDLGLSADDLEQGAEELNRMARDEESEQKKEELKQMIEQLRQILRQQNGKGSGQKIRLARFQNRAKGRASSASSGEPSGQKDEGERPNSPSGSEGDEGNEKQGRGEQVQSDKNGQNQQGKKETLSPDSDRDGKENTILLFSRKSNGMGGSTQKNEGRSGAGIDHNPQIKGKATSSLGRTQDSEMVGQDTGQGPSRSQVIESASETGFSRRSYEKVFREYSQVAEETLHKESIPSGYRFYIRRYFELIRPRTDISAVSDEKK